MNQQNSSGFVLIIVIGILGVLSSVALVLVSTSRSTANISRHHLTKSKLHILARSGIECAVSNIANNLNNGTGFSTPPNHLETALHVSLGSSVSGSDQCQVSWQDASGCINLNDGIVAGRMELGNLYRANALDPWPPSSTLGSYDEDPSAWINLRLRRLLNAYGDAHRFAALIGWPAWKNPEQSPPGPSWRGGPNYGTTFEFTASAAGNRYESMPAGAGLGDAVIAARKSGGFNSLQDVRDILDNWAKNHVPESYLNGGSFYEMVKTDLTTHGRSDSEAVRITREFGRDLNGDGHADYQNDFTHDTLMEGNTPLMAPLDSEPPDITNLWRRHSVHLINLNSASNFVRSAVFYSPVNVSYSCEGQTNFTYLGSSSSMNAVAPLLNKSPTVGTGGPVFSEANIQENGVHGYDAANPMLPHVQRNRLMSLRDAMVLSQAYEFHGNNIAWPDSFEAFTQALRNIRKQRQYLERVSIPVSDPGDPLPIEMPAMLTHGTVDMRHFPNNYLEATLPHIYSLSRRLPGWLGAPIALLSPYHEYDGGSFGHPGHALRSCEDFVKKIQHPKLSFTASGTYTIHSQATITESDNSFSNKIVANIEMFKYRTLRSQEDFIRSADPSSSTDISFGPEPAGVTPSRHLGVIGLKDRGESIPGGQHKAFVMNFNDTLAGAGTLTPTDSDNDPQLDSSTVIDAIVDEPPLNFWTDVTDVSEVDNALFLLNATPDPGKTWKVPVPGAQALEIFYDLTAAAYGLPVPMSGSGDLDAWIPQFMTAMGMPYVAGRTTNAYAWQIFNFFGFGGPFTWSEHWGVHGEPRAAVDTLPQTELKNSNLEGPEVSMFSPGSSGSDLSPFGGILLSSTNHGPHSPEFFSDSLYFRPDTHLLGSSNAIGTYGNKGLISMWVRIPTGYRRISSSKWNQQDRKTLFHGTFWERVTTKNSSGIEDVKLRPVTICSWLDNSYQLSNKSSGNLFSASSVGMGNGPVSLDPWPDLDTIPHPSSLADYLANPVFHGMMGRSSTGVSGWNWENDFKFGSSTVQPFSAEYWHLRRPSEALGGNPYAARPGSWTRIVVRWDFSQPGVKTKSIIGITHNPSCYDNYGLIQGGNQGSRDSFNSKMAVSIGEIQKVRSSHEIEQTDSGSNPYQYPPLPGVDALFPMERLNSCIDNVVVQFGGFPNAEFAPLDRFNQNDDNPGRLYDAVKSIPEFDFRRYDISPANQPSLAIDPGLPEGARVLALGARIYDVPFSPQNGGSWTAWTVRAPRIDMTLENSSGIINPSGQSHAISESTGPTTTAVIKSRAWSVYSFHPVDPSTKFRLRYRNVDPDGNDLTGWHPSADIITDIPWIKEIWWAHETAAGPTYSSWDES